MALHLAYQTLWISGILKPQSKFGGGFREWIDHGQWAPDGHIKSKQADLLVYDRSEFTDSLVNDFIVLATAAFESAASVTERQADPNGCAWQIISYYYAAYFAANALMRLSEHICTNIDANSCFTINEIVEVYNPGLLSEAHKLKPAPFYCVYQQADQRLVMRGLDGVKGGVHIQFWSGFLRFLEDLKGSLKRAPITLSDRKAAIQELNDLKGVLTFGGKNNGSWLSEVRNAVNYRFENGVWFPYTDARVTGHEIRESLRRGINGSSGIVVSATSSPDCARMVSVSGFMLRWLNSALGTIEEKARYKKKQRIKDGAMAFASAI